MFNFSEKKANAGQCLFSHSLLTVLFVIPLQAVPLLPSPTIPLNYVTLLEQGCWVPTYGYGGKTDIVATIPTDRVQEFKTNEEARLNGVQFFTASSRGAASSSLPKSMLSRTVFHCQHGPEDNTKPEIIAASKAAEESGEKKARHLISDGKSIKIGCKCHYTVAVYKDTPGLARITYNVLEHTGHDPSIDQAACLSEGTKQFILSMLHNNPDASSGSIQAALREQVFRRFEPAHPGCGRERVMEIIETLESLPRDMCVTPQHINSIRQKYARERYSWAGSEHESVRILVQKL